MRAHSAASIGSDRKTLVIEKSATDWCCTSHTGMAGPGFSASLLRDKAVCRGKSDMKTVE